MVRPLSVFMSLAAATLVVNAHIADYFKNILEIRLFASPQLPLGSIMKASATEFIVSRNTRNITSENWRTSVNVTVDPAAADEAAQEWLFYFATSHLPAETENTNHTAREAKNLTAWEMVFNATVYAASTARPALSLKFGKIDCSTIAAEELCNSFLLSSRKLPVFYHIATYLNNGTTQIREIPWKTNITDDEKPLYLAKFHSEKKWKAVKPWEGVLNPIDGLLKAVTPYLGHAQKYYNVLPAWVLMLVVSLVGRSYSTRIAARIAPAHGRTPRQQPTPSNTMSL